MTKLDRIDLRILSVLQKYGRITKQKLANEVNLSVSPCWVRLKRLEDAGIIDGYHAEVRLDKLANFTTVLVEIALKHHAAEDFQRFENAMYDAPHIIDCYATGGGVDYVLKVVAQDIDHYQTVIDGMLEQNIGIDRYFTYIVTKTVKKSRFISIQQVLDTNETTHVET
ncbi:MAG: Leucine-responsive regulatory protein [Gammaproteobacteria bacterium]|nr:Leucine-responsive regulatory protein [Gammaproteobacteria bacterium]